MRVTGIFNLLIINNKNNIICIVNGIIYGIYRV